MKLDAIRHGDTFRIDLVPADGSDFGCNAQLGSTVSIIRSESTGEIIAQIGSTNAIAVKGSTPSNSAHLDRLMASPRARLLWVAVSSPKSGSSTTIGVQVHEFTGKHLVNRMTIGVNDLFVEKVGERIPDVSDTPSLITWMTETFVLPTTQADRQIVVAQVATAEGASSQSKAFRILGAQWAVDVASDSEDRLQAHRLVSIRAAQTTSVKRPPRLLDGEIEFADSTFATRFKAESSLDSIVRDASSYLAIWQHYQRLETAAITRRARQFGSVPYGSCLKLDNGNWCFSVARQFLDSGRTLHDLPLDDFEIECVNAVPKLLSTGADDDVLELLDDIQPNERTPFTGTALRAHDTELILRPADLDARMQASPPADGYLVACLRGDMVRLKRRRDAWERIRRQSCPMTHLGHLLEGQAVPVPQRKRHDPLSKEVDVKFGGSPTTSQMRALDIALNTPDIAVIQGPPGTGKTRVLAALLARLSELEGTDRLSGGVLLTGYQHTAVENAVMSASTLGLPPIKIGRKRGGVATIDPAAAWATDQTEHVRSVLDALPDAPLRQRLRRLRELISAYQHQLPGQDECQAVLRNAFDLLSECISPALRDQISDRMHLVESTPSANASGSDDTAVAEERRLVRALRFEPEAFLDDGPRNAHRVLTHPGLQRRLSEMTRTVLERARDWLEPDPLQFLESIAHIREGLLDDMAVPPAYLAVRRLDPNVLAILEEAERELALKVETGQDGIADVLWDYLEALEGDSLAVRESLERYTLVLAATCQHAVHRKTLQAKGLGDTESIQFETVVVDEAARATPLDLLIPMSLAERRIVLVGDHRQLPHLLEPDIERELSVSVNDETKAALRDSLFQRMFKHLRSLEARDGVPRTITLDQQFRMHPTLGEFVSRSFYGEDEQFTSPRPASEFLHNLTCIPECPAAWIDVPRQRGREQGGRSKSRPAEARLIADWVTRVGNERSDLSIGVIAFYGDQVREIERAMERVGIGQIESGEFRRAPEWQFVARPDGRQAERLRVGTVDAFQGMEFDVVFMSVTRCSDLRDGTETQQRRKYGFLMLPNRLCVAMSRQKRLLVAVGDLSLTREPNATSAIPGLVQFRELCESDAGEVIDA